VVWTTSWAWLLISRQDRVQVWASQLAANDFPPVCAMTGAPAETWRKFRFATPPIWARALSILVAILVAERASGFLPLTKASSRLVGFARWVPRGMVVGSGVLWLAIGIAAAANVGATAPNAGDIAGALVFIGVLLLVGGLVGRFVVMPLVCPRGRVTVPPGYRDKLVELRNVHPAFVAAVTQINQMRAQQFASMRPQAAVPIPPGPN
jgi:hypothetical protein